MSGVLSKTIVISLALLLVINPLLSFLGIVHSGVYEIDYYEGGNKYIIGDNFDIYDEYADLAEQYDITEEDFPDAWSEIKDTTHTLLDSMTFLSYTVGLPYKYGNWTEEGLAAAQGKEISYIPDIDIISLDLALGNTAINAYMLGHDISYTDFDLSEEEWESMSNISKLLLIYNHPNFISPNRDTDKPWYEEIWDFLSGGLVQIIK